MGPPQCLATVSTSREREFSCESTQGCGCGWGGAGSDGKALERMRVAQSSARAGTGHSLLGLGCVWAPQ